MRPINTFSIVVRYCKKFYRHCILFGYFFQDENAHGEADIKQKCRSYETVQDGYSDFFPIKEVTGSRPDGYIVNFPLFIQAAKEVRILLATRPASPDSNDDCYEICRRFS